MSRRCRAAAATGRPPAAAAACAPGAARGATARRATLAPPRASRPSPRRCPPRPRRRCRWPTAPRAAGALGRDGRRSPVVALQPAISRHRANNGRTNRSMSRKSGLAASRPPASRRLAVRHSLSGRSNAEPSHGGLEQLGPVGGEGGGRCQKKPTRRAGARVPPPSCRPSRRRRSRQDVLSTGEFAILMASGPRFSRGPAGSACPGRPRSPSARRPAGGPV
jgi:hypothetical protein